MSKYRDIIKTMDADDRNGLHLPEAVAKPNYLDTNLEELAQILPEIKWKVYELADKGVAREKIFRVILDYYKDLIDKYEHAIVFMKSTGTRPPEYDNYQTDFDRLLELVEQKYNVYMRIHRRVNDIYKKISNNPDPNERVHIQFMLVFGEEITGWEHIHGCNCVETYHDTENYNVGYEIVDIEVDAKDINKIGKEYGHTKYQIDDLDGTFVMTWKPREE